MTKLRVYVAGASRELDRVLPIVAKLEASGLVRITARWFDAVAAWGIGRDHELTLEQQREHALNDLRGVLEADLFWALWPEAPSAGVPLEFGFAIAAARYHSEKALVVSGARASSCIFTSLALGRYATDEEALALVLGLASQGADRTTDTTTRAADVGDEASASPNEEP